MTRILLASSESLSLFSRRRRRRYDLGKLPHRIRRRRSDVNEISIHEEVIFVVHCL